MRTTRTTREAWNESGRKKNKKDALAFLTQVRDLGPGITTSKDLYSDAKVWWIFHVNIPFVTQFKKYKIVKTKVINYNLKNTLGFLVVMTENSELFYFDEKTGISIRFPAICIPTQVSQVYENLLERKENFCTSLWWQSGKKSILISRSTIKQNIYQNSFRLYLVMIFLSKILW